MQPPMQGI